MQFEEKEEMPYRKKKESSVSKSEAKSKHKHIYNKVVIVAGKLKHGTIIAQAYNYCPVCGKIGSWATNFIENGKVLLLEDLIERFPDAEIYRIDIKSAMCTPKNIEELKNKNIF